MARTDKPGRKPYREDQYTTIVFLSDNPQPVKYRKVELARPGKLQAFLRFLDRRFPTWTTINVYGGLSKTFINQINHVNRYTISFFVSR